jgi:hypothetical protein
MKQFTAVLAVFCCLLLLHSAIGFELSGPDSSSTPPVSYQGMPIKLITGQSTAQLYTIKLNEESVASKAVSVWSNSEGNVDLNIEFFHSFMHSLPLSTQSGPSLYSLVSIDVFTGSDLQFSTQIRIVSRCTYLRVYKNINCGHNSLCHIAPDGSNYCECVSTQWPGVGGKTCQETPPLLYKQEGLSNISALEAGEDTITLFGAQLLTLMNASPSNGDYFALKLVPINGEASQYPSLDPITRSFALDSNGYYQVPMLAHTHIAPMYFEAKLLQISSAGLILWATQLPIIKLVNTCQYRPNSTPCPYSNNPVDCLPWPVSGSRCTSSLVSLPTCNRYQISTIHSSTKFRSGGFSVSHSPGVNVNYSGSTIVAYISKSDEPPIPLTVTPTFSSSGIGFSFASPTFLLASSQWFITFATRGTIGDDQDRCLFNIPFLINDLGGTFTFDAIPPLSLIADQRDYNAYLSSNMVPSRFFFPLLRKGSAFIADGRLFPVGHDVINPYLQAQDPKMRLPYNKILTRKEQYSVDYSFTVRDVDNNQALKQLSSSPVYSRESCGVDILPNEITASGPIFYVTNPDRLGKVDLITLLESNNTPHTLTIISYEYISPALSVIYTESFVPTSGGDISVTVAFVNESGAPLCTYSRQIPINPCPLISVSIPPPKQFDLFTTGLSGIQIQPPSGTVLSNVSLQLVGSSSDVPLTMSSGYSHINPPSAEDIINANYAISQKLNFALILTLLVQSRSYECNLTTNTPYSQIQNPIQSFRGSIGFSDDNMILTPVLREDFSPYKAMFDALFTNMTFELSLPVTPNDTLLSAVSSIKKPFQLGRNFANSDPLSYNVSFNYGFSIPGQLIPQALSCSSAVFDSAKNLDLLDFYRQGVQLSIDFPGVITEVLAPYYTTDGKTIKYPSLLSPPPNSSGLQTFQFKPSPPPNVLTRVSYITIPTIHFVSESDLTCMLQNNEITFIFEDPFLPISAEQFTHVGNPLRISLPLKKPLNYQFFSLTARSITVYSSADVLLIRFDYPVGADWTFNSLTGAFEISVAINTLPPGDYSLMVNYFDAKFSKVSFTVTDSDPYPMSTTKQQIVGKNAILGWTIPTNRYDQYKSQNAPPTLQYQFTLHASDPSQHVISAQAETLNPPDPRTAYAILHGDATFSQIDPSASITFLNLYQIPETATEVRLILPKLPQSLFPYGFKIVMTVIQPENPTLYHSFQNNNLVWEFSQSQFPEVTCVGCEAGVTECDKYSGICIPIQPSTSPIPTWNVSPLVVPTTGQCKLICPLHFTPNGDCTQCVCLDATCQTYTRSYQVKFRVPSGWYQNGLYKTLNHGEMFSSYIATYLSNALGLSQLPPRPLSTNFNGLYTGSPRSTIDLGSPKDSLNVGPEALFIQFLNPASIAASISAKQYPLYHFERLLITISTHPLDSTPTAQAIAARFTELHQRLLYISTMQSFLERNPVTGYHPYLPFSIAFSTENDRVQLVDYKKIFASAPTAATTQCQSYLVNTLYNSCPLPTKTLLSTQYWSQCSSTSGLNQSLLPVCLDFFGQLVPVSTSDTPSWCQKGWYNYPAVSSIDSCPKEVKYDDIPVDKNIAWTPQKDVQISSNNDSVLVTWEWGSNFNPTLTIDVLYYTSPKAYSQVLTTVLASKRAVTVKIPENTSNGNFNAHIRLRCTQYAKYQTSLNDLLTLSVRAVNKCTSDCIGANKQCIRSTGLCVCLPGFTQSLDSNDCVLPCTGKCASPEFCVVETPNVCGKCPEGTLPPLCSTPANCSNDSTTGLNSQCKKHGFIQLEENLCSKKCTCVSHQFWGGDDCSICNLVDINTTDPAVTQCVLKHTDVAKTRRDVSDNGGLECQACACLPGYSGQFCEIESLRGTVTYSLVGEPQIPVEDGDDEFLIQSDPNQPDDPNGLHFVSPQGLIVLQRDMELSLGLDAGSVTIINIFQTQQASLYIAMNPTQTPTTSTTSTTITYAANTGLSSLGDLTNAWNGLKNSYPQLPVGNTEVSGEIGQANNVGDAIQPGTGEPVECNPETHRCDCSEAEKLANGGQCPLKLNKNSSTTGIIVGVVVGVAVVVLIFVSTILLTRWAKKNEKWCFAPQKRQKPRNDNHPELTMSETNSTISMTDTKLTTKSANSSTAIDLIEITDHGEALPSGWSKHKHTVTGQIMYVNQVEMRSQKHSPLQEDDAGNGW